MHTKYLIDEKVERENLEADVEDLKAEVKWLTNIVDQLVNIHNDNCNKIPQMRKSIFK